MEVLSEFWAYSIMRTDWDHLDSGRFVYIVFNSVEAFAWWGIGFYVLSRHFRSAATPYEWLYFMAFLLFGFSDILEAQELTVSLLGFKLAILMSIIALRKIVIGHYPKATF